MSELTFFENRLGRFLLDTDRYFGLSIANYGMFELTFMVDFYYTELNILVSI